MNDVIENNGRIIHEATSDEYTHEVVDRGEYILADYYFSRREAGKKLIFTMKYVQMGCF